MPLTAISLASGSSGNALLLHNGAQAILIDCGLTQRALERHLAHAGLGPHSLHAILLTHEHSDHTGCALAFARRHQVPIVCNQRTGNAASLGDTPRCELPTGQTAQFGDFTVTSFAVSHDAAEPVGLVVRNGGCTVSIATDLGCWDPQVAMALAEGDLVVVEANHDRERLRLTNYTADLKQRIAGNRGHLDNIEAGRLLAQIGRDGRRRTAWLAHLSREANSPDIALRMVRGVLTMSQVGCIAVQALPRHATLSWTSDMLGEQLQLFE